MEELFQQGAINLFYGDETRVRSAGYVPYGWPFPDENVYIPVTKAHKIDLWGLINRHDETHWATTEQNIDAAFIFARLEQLPFRIQKQTVVVGDDARVHKAKVIQNQVPFWESRGLCLFYLPTYSPRLNIAETRWRKPKKEQLAPLDCLSKDTLLCAVNRWLAQAGKLGRIKFADFIT